MPKFSREEFRSWVCGSIGYVLVNACLAFSWSLTLMLGLAFAYSPVCGLAYVTLRSQVDDALYVVHLLLMPLFSVGIFWWTSSQVLRHLAPLFRRKYLLRLRRVRKKAMAFLLILVWVLSCGFTAFSYSVYLELLTTYPSVARAMHDLYLTSEWLASWTAQGQSTVLSLEETGLTFVQFQVIFLAFLRACIQLVTGYFDYLAAGDADAGATFLWSQWSDRRGTLRAYARRLFRRINRYGVPSPLLLPGSRARRLLIRLLQLGLVCSLVLAAVYLI